ncbi:hypothetical protein ACFX2I_005316 [Malus domestica]|uniref:uncharacterized protein LOC126584592 n=1 Tax=Malus sylvestris TaxID=3752 RepID=UPI0010AB40CE|nr:uncharacterized protein LOC103429757 [Malus domestica]XP_050104874.1 uncharacterized protein LOC126584592 [Malus sylvestris]
MEMKMMSALVFGLMVIVVNQASPAYGDITCRQALMDLKPCEAYVKGSCPGTHRAYVKGSGPGTPPISCCHGLKTVFTAANTSESQIKLSKMLQETIAGMQLRLDRIMQLPHL